MARPPSAQAMIDGYWRRSAAIGALAAAIVAWPDAMAQTRARRNWRCG
ncbi:hypothetical protein ACWGM0_18630 (plasmid) [Sphingomonas bisphenolicum]